MVLAAEAAHQIPVAHAIVLGIVQGLSEFLPISSSGHLILVPWLFGWKELSGAANADLKRTFDVALHAGTFLGAALYFRNDLARLARAAWRSTRRRRVEANDERLAWLLVVSAVPAAVAGALIESAVSDALARIPLVGILLIVFGIVLLAADRRPGERAVGEFRLRDAVVMGIGQAAALAPGVSRSGVTISAGRWLGFERDSAARISFLMSLPIIGGAGLYKGAEVVAEGGLPSGAAGAFVWGTASSAVTGALAVWLVLRVVRSRSFLPFVAYRVAVGVGVLGLALARFRA